MSGYDTDFFSWTQEQASLLRDGLTAKLDAEHLAEELEAMGRSERRALKQRMTVLLKHLLKYRYQPELRCASWRASIYEARRRITDLVEESPSLAQELDLILTERYPVARTEASIETGIDTLLEACPWSLAEVPDERFLSGE